MAEFAVEGNPSIVLHVYLMWSSVGKFAFFLATWDVFVTHLFMVSGTNCSDGSAALPAILIHSLEDHIYNLDMGL